MDYTSLTNDIKTNTFRKDAVFVNQIPTFINDAINKLYSEARTMGLQVTLSPVIQNNMSLIAGNAFFDKPAVPPNAWKETISFQIVVPETDPYLVTLWSRSFEFCTNYWPVFGATSAPLFYADYSDTQFYISPTPDRSYAVILTFITLPLFDATNSENFFTRKYPALLRAACMIEAALFVRNDGLSQKWTAAYERAKSNLLGDTAQHIDDRSTKRGKD